MAEWAHHTVPRERVFAPALEDGQAAVLDAVREAVLDVLMHERHAFYTDYLAAHTHGTAPPQGDEADEAEEPPLSAAAAAAERAELMQRALAVYARICDDNFLHRYARARAYDVERTCTKVLNSIAWHLAVRPETIRAAEFEEEARTGKIYIGGTDVHGRAVIVLDNTKASALDHDGQMRHLIWSMQRAVRRMQPGGREKFVVFIHLEDFGFTTAPSLRTTQETIKILGGHFPERLGHCVLYKAPYLFWTLWNMVKPIIDVVTREKVVMISGDTSEGTSNDHMLVVRWTADILGADWRTLSGAEQPVLAAGASPGYDHAVKWAEALQEEEQLLATSPSSASIASSPPNHAPSPPPAGGS